MSKRTGISKSTRFSVFARDNFTCRYCGLQSDRVRLAVDHITPVCQGGSNEPENLITSCESCNQGKGGRTIAQSAPTESDRLRILQEHQEQIALHAAAMESAVMRKEMRQNICNYCCEVFHQETMSSEVLSVFCAFAYEHGVNRLFEWVDIAHRYLRFRPSWTKIGKYVSGVRRNFKRQSEQNQIH
jgi:hypothetical protein